MNVLYANISGGLVFAGQKYGEMLFSQVSVEHYIDYFKPKQIDILSLSEVHLEDKTSSRMVKYIASSLNLPYHASMALSKSHLDTSKQLGMAVISRFPIIKQEAFAIPAPEPPLTVERPDGNQWTLHDKGGQRVYLDVLGRTISLVNFSYFPFHHFGHRVDEPAFKDLRVQLLEILLGEDEQIPTIITGDFNNKGAGIKEAFAELFADGTLEQSVDLPTTVVGYDNEQLDHILYQPRYFRSSGSFGEVNGSDHLAIGAVLELYRAA